MLDHQSFHSVYAGNSRRTKRRYLVELNYTIPDLYEESDGLRVSASCFMLDAGVNLVLGLVRLISSTPPSLNHRHLKTIVHLCIVT
ncbi:hypothetical protein AVEN_219451-1 [Araneus ventricosus]|uniref:Uncharacterized protein n=1 Tax=Araneus ventricosus TaxID=182803 RepID=A0A4Y2BM57_ARAVE|nr:hypothetical protein AVEN_219451-1 [Araneus ventricosus]